MDTAGLKCNNQVYWSMNFHAAFSIWKSILIGTHMTSSDIFDSFRASLFRFSFLFMPYHTMSRNLVEDDVVSSYTV